MYELAKLYSDYFERVPLHNRVEEFIKFQKLPEEEIARKLRNTNKINEETILEEIVNKLVGFPPVITLSGQLSYVKKIEYNKLKKVIKVHFENGEKMLLKYEPIAKKGNYVSITYLPTRELCYDIVEKKFLGGSNFVSKYYNTYFNEEKSLADLLQEEDIPSTIKKQFKELGLIKGNKIDWKGIRKYILELQEKIVEFNEFSQ